MHILEDVVRGEIAILEGRTYNQAEAKKVLRKWLK